MADIARLQQLRTYFQTGVTRPLEFRRQKLKDLRTSILNHEEEIFAALYSDLKKSREECWVTENGIVISELNLVIRKLHKWMKPEKRKTNFLNFPSSSRIEREPLGVVLIIGPWNYPFQLLLNPVVGAIAAGNTIVVKPSEFAPATAAVIKKIIEGTFPPEYFLFTEGDGATVIPGMMNNFSFDHVFYTGSTTVGKIIYKMAAEKLTPVTLELGGKSPCIVEPDANIKVAARRIAVTKFSNAGQMCIAPDYVLVAKEAREKFVEEISLCIKRFYSDNPAQSYSYGKIINEKQFDRLAGYLKSGKILFGGKMNRDELYIEPTLISDIPAGEKIMREEIFGPVLPVLEFTSMKEALNIIRMQPDPLSFYVYTSSAKKEREWLDAVPSGGACINNSSWHFTNPNIPFGGRGASGMGSYHGKFSFDNFSHKKAVMKTPTWFDPAFRYPPFNGKLRLYKKVIR